MKFAKQGIAELFQAVCEAAKSRKDVYLYVDTSGDIPVNHMWSLALRLFTLCKALDVGLWVSTFDTKIRKSGYFDTKQFSASGLAVDYNCVFKDAEEKRIRKIIIFTHSPKASAQRLNYCNREAIWVVFPHDFDPIVDTLLVGDRIRLSYEKEQAA